MIGEQASYRINLTPKKLSHEQIALHTTIYKSNKHGDEVIVDQEFVLDVGDPAIVAVPYVGRAVAVDGLNENRGDPAQNSNRR